VKLNPRLLWLLATVLFSWCSTATEPLKWAIGHVPPYIYIEEDGQPYGIHAEIIKNILKHPKTS
jgi:hypothetical protein